MGKFTQDGHSIPLEFHDKKLQYKRRLYQDFTISKWQTSRHAKAFEVSGTLAEKESGAKRGVGGPQQNEGTSRFIPKK